MTLLSSCSTVVNGRSQDVQINANVPNARIYLDGVERGVPPSAVSVKRKGTHHVEVHAKGYTPYRQELKSSLSGWFAGNLLLGGLIGMGVDLCTGACWTYDTVNAVLVPGKDEPVTASAQATGTKTTTNTTTTGAKNPAREGSGVDGFFDAVLGEN